MDDFTLTALVFFVLGFNTANLIWQLILGWIRRDRQRMVDTLYQKGGVLDGNKKR